jgi:hypothetical protein
MSKFNTILIWISVLAIVGGISYMLNIVMMNPPMQPITLEYVTGGYSDYDPVVVNDEPIEESAPSALEELEAAIPEEQREAIEQGRQPREKRVIPEQVLYEARVYDYQQGPLQSDGSRAPSVATLKVNGQTFIGREGQTVKVVGVPLDITIIELKERSVTLRVGDEHSETWINERKSAYWNCPELGKEDRLRRRTFGQ